MRSIGSTKDLISKSNAQVRELSYRTIQDYIWKEPKNLFLDPEFYVLGNYLKLFPGQLIALFGKSGEGKTTFLFQLLLYMAKKFDRKAIIFSSEQTMMSNAREFDIMTGGNYKELIMTHFVFIEPEVGVMTIEMLLDKIDEVVYSRKGDGMNITDIVVDPFNSLFTEKGRMIGYDERIPLLVNFKKAAEIYKATWWVTGHAKTRVKVRGNYTALREPDDYEGGREVHNKVDAFLTVERVEKTVEVPHLVNEGRTEEQVVQTNILRVSNLKTKYARKYRRGAFFGCYDVDSGRYYFGDELLYNEDMDQYMPQVDVTCPMSIFDDRSSHEFEIDYHTDTLPNIEEDPF